MNPFDLSVFHFVNGLAGQSAILDAVMTALAEYAPVVCALLFVGAWFVLPRGEVTTRHALVVAAVGGLLALFVNMLIGYIWFRPRPFVVLPPSDITLLLNHAATASFPSSHVAGAAGFAAGCWRRTPRWVSWSFCVIALVLVVARVFVGVHWPTDVIAGLVVGIVAGSAAWIFSPPLSYLTRFGMWLTRQQK